MTEQEINRAINILAHAEFHLRIADRTPDDFEAVQIMEQLEREIAPDNVMDVA